MASPSPAPILIVDDNAETRYVLQRVLEIKGYSTVVARSGPEALRYLREGNRVGLIILDISMPGMDGTAVHAALKRDPELSRIPIIVFSGVDAKSSLDDVVAYLRKGVDPDTLLALIEDTCPVTGSRLPPRS